MKKSSNIFIVFVIFIFGLLIIQNGIQVNASNTTENTNPYENLHFSLYNNSSAYKVSAANKQITEAIIPATYNGLPVTEIADNGFSSCTNLTYVFVPHSVTRIGSNAFINCANLEKILGMPKVKIYGNNAFAMCPKLNNLILPLGIESLGSNLLRNNPNDVYSRTSEAEMNALNPNWNSYRAEGGRVLYGNDLAMDEVYDADNNLIGYNITGYQMVNFDDEVTILETWYTKDEINYYPVLNIEQYAFAFCSFNKFEIKDKENVEKNVINIKSFAFFECMANEINITCDIILEDEATFDSSYATNENGKSISVFAGSMVTKVTLPNTLTYLPRSTFENCTFLTTLSNTNENIQDNYISNQISEIHTDAFAGCTLMESIYIPSSVQIMGDNVFDKWGTSTNNQTIYINLVEPATGWNSNWFNYNEEVNYNATINFLKVSVILNKNDDSGDTFTIEVEKGSPMPSAPKPVRFGYRFLGYFSNSDGTGTKYYDENMNSVNIWTSSVSTTLYAKWDKIETTIICSNIPNPFIKQVKFGDTMPVIEMPSKVGYIFKGIFTGENGTGTQYYDANGNGCKTWDKDVDQITLYAHWELITYTIIYKNLQDGINPNQHITTYTIEDSITLAAPVRGGYVGSWSISSINHETGNKTIYASWREKTFSELLNSYNEYEIWTNSQFNYIKQYATNEYKFVLMKDFTLSNWEGIPVFRGRLDLNTHTITYSNNAVAYNQNYGFIIENYGTIFNGSFKPKIIVQTGTGGVAQLNAIGGAVAVNRGTLLSITVKSYIGENNDYMNGNGTNVDIQVLLRKNYSIGGVVGHNYNQVTFCDNYASIGASDSFGGIVGLNFEGAVIKNCTNYGDMWYQMISNGQNQSGGIVGTVRDRGFLYKCVNYGTITFALKTTSNALDIQYLANIAGAACTTASFNECESYGNVVIADGILLSTIQSQGVKTNKDAIGFYFTI